LLCAYAGHLHVTDVDIALVAAKVLYVPLVALRQCVCLVKDQLVATAAARQESLRVTTAAKPLVVRHIVRQVKEQVAALATPEARHVEQRIFQPRRCHNLICW
jgi:hypothetical protein